MKCSLTDGKQRYEWIFNPAVVTTGIVTEQKQYTALKGDTQYIYFLGTSESLSIPLSIPGVHSNLNPTLSLLRQWVRNSTKLYLDYGSIQYPEIYLTSITENFIQFRDGQPVSADIKLDFIVGSSPKEKPASTIDTGEKTDREKAKG